MAAILFKPQLINDEFLRIYLLFPWVLALYHAQDTRDNFGEPVSAGPGSSDCSCPRPGGEIETFWFTWFTKPRHTHATTPVSRKYQFSSAKLHVSMFLDDIASCHAVPMTLTCVFTALLDIPIATPAGEIHFWVSVPLELHAVARPLFGTALY